MLSSFARRIKLFIDRNLLLKPEGFYLVALSGGCDSVALLRVMIELDYHIAVIHCNFQLRGEESERDEHFCEELCNSQKVPFHRVHFDTREYAELHHISIEMAARELRYQYFEQLRKDICADAILVAHHQDDTVETVLLNLIRGTGIHGLQGIKPKNGHVIRPLLSMTRNDIENYLSSIQQTFITDSSNLIADIKRNKIRLKVLPLLREINPSVSESITLTAKHLNDAAKVFDNALQESVERVTLIRKADRYVVDIDKLEREISPEQTLYSILKNFSFSSVQIENIACSLDAPTGKKWLSNTHEAVIDRGTLVIAPLLDASNKVLKVPETGCYVWDDKVKFNITSHVITPEFKPSHDPDIITIDAEKVFFPLIIRYARQGDRFHPFGMAGSKLVSDYLTDLKLSLVDKQRQIVIEDAKGKLLWIVGRRIDNHFGVTNQTKGVLALALMNE